MTTCDKLICGMHTNFRKIVGFLGYVLTIGMISVGVYYHQHMKSLRGQYEEEHSAYMELVAAVDQSDVGVVVADGFGRIRFTNRAANKMMGSTGSLVGVDVHACLVQQRAVADTAYEEMVDQVKKTGVAHSGLLDCEIGPQKTPALVNVRAFMREGEVMVVGTITPKDRITAIRTYATRQK